MLKSLCNTDILAMTVVKNRGAGVVLIVRRKNFQTIVFQSTIVSNYTTHSVEELLYCILYKNYNNNFIPMIIASLPLELEMHMIICQFKMKSNGSATEVSVDSRERQINNIQYRKYLKCASPCYSRVG